MTGRDDAHTFGLPIEHIAQIELTLVTVGDLDIHPLHRLSIRASLYRNQTLSQKVSRGLLNLMVCLAQPDSASLTAATRMNLRFHGPMPAAEFCCGINRLVCGECD